LPTLIPTSTEFVPSITPLPTLTPSPPMPTITALPFLTPNEATLQTMEELTATSMYAIHEATQYMLDLTATNDAIIMTPGAPTLTPQPSATYRPEIELTVTSIYATNTAVAEFLNMTETQNARMHTLTPTVADSPEFSATPTPTP